MKAVWRIGVWVLGIALFGFAVERIGSGRVRGELEAMSSAITMIFALSLIHPRWPGVAPSRTHTGEGVLTLRGAIECKL